MGGGGGGGGAQCETVLGERGEDWESIAISTRCLCVKDGAFGECSREPVWNIRDTNGGESRAEEAKAKTKNRANRKTGSYATLNIMTQAIDGIVGKISAELAALAMRSNEAIDSPDPTYGYLRGSQFIHEKIDYDLDNDWVQNDLDEMIYVDRLRGDTEETCIFMCQVGGWACRYRMKYTRGVGEDGEIWGRLAELRIDKVAVRKEILQRQSGEGDIPDGLRVELRYELRNIDK